ncbi:BQ5605_C001g00631 [Microbotryum silenes-dioicae]|uniref:BQ5605_C001g00631 protein n=1 Tax=Microbotryum silenes-dioicae TaxID=796604 RepID=A0A2X0P0I3_9BASI|nr:BQ5605_C001g00631 [Microbotryum silenes-dioicae]
MTTSQPILALRHVYEPAVQLCRTDSVVSAMANSTLGSPHHHLRKGECAGLESRSNPSSPTFSQGKLLQGSDSDAKAFRENARSYNNALSFTSLAAHWDQTQVGTLGPPTWLIDPAEATDTRLQGPDSAETRIQRSTLTKLESMLRTGNRLVREFASAKARAGWDTAKEWVLRLCLPPGRDRRTHNLPTSSTEMAMLICDSDTNTGDRGPQDLILQVHGDRCPDGRPKYQIVSSLHPSAMPLRYPLLFPAGEDGFHPNIPLCGSIELGHSSPKDSNKEGEDEEEGDKKNGDGEHKHLWLLLGYSHSVKARAQTDIECLNTYDEGQVKGVKVVSLAFTNPLRSTCTNATSPHGTRRPFPAFVIERYSQAEADRLNYIQLH